MESETNRGVEAWHCVDYRDTVPAAALPQAPTGTNAREESSNVLRTKPAAILASAALFLSGLLLGRVIPPTASPPPASGVSRLFRRIFSSSSHGSQANEAESLGPSRAASCRPAPSHSTALPVSLKLGSSSCSAELPEIDALAEQQAAVRLLKGQVRAWCAATNHDHESKDITLKYMVGRGAHGTVYAGSWKGLSVAVKRTVVRLEPGTDLSRECSLREGRLSLELSHGHIVPTYRVVVRQLPSPEVGALLVREQGAAPGQVTLPTPSTTCLFEVLLLQELCRQSLHQLLCEGGLHGAQGRPDTGRILRLALDVALGLRAMHAQDVVHGDVKPENVVLSEAPGRASVGGLVAKLCDLSMSVPLGSSSHATGNHAGTPLYVAPEVSSRGILSKAADMYSFGITLWQLFANVGPAITSASGYKRPHPDFVQWRTTSARLAPTSYVLLCIACVSPAPAQRPPIEVAVSVLKDLCDLIHSERAPPGLQSFEESMRAFRAASGTQEDDLDPSEELSLWLRHLNAVVQRPARDSDGSEQPP